MAFTEIDMTTWPRRDHYYYYSEIIKTNYQVNVDIDVTKLRKHCKKMMIRFYPTMIYIIMKAINRNENFRMAINEDGHLGYYDVCHPSYTIFHEDDHTFSDVWTEWDDDFDQFYEYAVADMEEYKNVKGIKAKGGRPDAFTPVSCVPWLSFSSVSHDTDGPRKMYFPIVVFGKYHKVNDRWMLPFSIMVNHAVADGYHTSMLIKDIQDQCKACKEWII